MTKLLNFLTKIATIELVIKCIKIDGKVAIITYQDLAKMQRLLDECKKNNNHPLWCN
jgi:hypothetical protein